jgi:multiple sugar transport system ATP-binding protein
MASVNLRGVQKRFGETEVIKGVDLDIDDHEFCVFVGPSGCGKSTLLRLIAGLEDISDGALQIGGRDVTNVPPANRGVAMVFQSYALYPHMSVAENIGFGLKMARMPKDEIDQRVGRAAEMLQLGPLLQRKPAQLSGGQRQRVAIGRAIVRQPGVFLFDEPLSNLDAALRVQMRIELSALHQDLDSTMIYVTHDQIEAMTMADKIVVLNGGRIEQVGSPLELYHRPNNTFVAGFIGSPKMNLLPSRVLRSANGTAEIALPGSGSIAIATGGSAPPADSQVTLGVRPEHIVLDGGAASFPGEVHLTEHLGNETMLYVTAPDGTELTVRGDGLSRAKAHDRVTLGLDPASCHLFDADGRALVNGSLLDA